MAYTPPFDIDKAHRYFGVECNNTIWKIIDKPQLSENDKSEIIHLANTSYWHWSKFSGCKKVNIARGLYMIALAYTYAQQKAEALLNAHKCLDFCESNKTEIKDFDLAYAYQIIARASALNQHSKTKHYIEKATELINTIFNPEDKKICMADFGHGNWYGYK